MGLTSSHLVILQTRLMESQCTHRIFSYPTPTQELRNLMVYAELSSFGLLICSTYLSGKYNSKCNFRGEELFDCITSAGLIALNVGQASMLLGPSRVKTNCAKFNELVGNKVTNVMCRSQIANSESHSARGKHGRTVP